MTASTSQATEARYSVYTPDGKTWKVWDASAERFVQNPAYDFPTTDFDFRADAARVRDELNDAVATAAEPATSDDEPTAPNRPVMLGHLRPQPRRRSGKVGSAMSVARRLANLAKTAARVNSGVVTVAQYLAELGADSDTIRRYAGTLGKHVKAAFTAVRGAEPARCGLALVGHHLARVFAYGRADTEILRAATAGYGRVAHLLNGAS